jgi:hypothetical protein
MHDRATVPTLICAEDVAVLRTVPLSDLPVGAPEIANLIMTACCNLVRDLGGTGWSPR